MALVEELPPATPGDRVVAIDFAGYENVAPYIFNRAQFLETVKRKRYEHELLPEEVVAPLKAMGDLQQAIADGPPDEIVLDITTLPRNYLFCICRSLAELALPTTLRYYRPKNYGTELSRGVRHVQAIPGFEGDVGPGGESVLAIVLGFEGYKAWHAWESVGPNKVIALFGDPPYEPGLLTISRAENDEFLRQIGDFSEGKLHTHDVRVARDQLQTLYGQLLAQDPQLSFVVCPLGTKLQSLAVFSLAVKNNQIAVIYVSSLNYYSEAYSRGYDPEFVEIPLAELTEAR